MNSVLLIQQSLLGSSRVGSLSRPESRLTAGEIAVLGGLGAVAAWATVFVQLRLGVPGHAILRGVLPMALGLALVPRSGSGTIMSLCAGLTASGFAFGHLARVQPSSMVGLISLGPLLDLTTMRAERGWRLYARLMAAGLAANLLAYATRFATAWLGLNGGGGGGGGGGDGGGGGGGGGGWSGGDGQFTTFATAALLSFILCGAIAGLVSGLLWFRASREVNDGTPHLGDAS